MAGIIYRIRNVINTWYVTQNLSTDKLVTAEIFSHIKNHLRSIFIGWLVNYWWLIRFGQDGSPVEFNLWRQSFKWRWHWHHCIVIWGKVPFWVTVCVDDFIFPKLIVTLLDLWSLLGGGFTSKCQTDGARSPSNRRIIIISQ